MGIFIFALIAFTWAALAAYLGMVAFLLTLPSVPRLAVFVFTAVVILVATACYLYDQDSYHWLDRFEWRDADHVFSAGTFALNACFYSGMTLSFLSTRRFPQPLRDPMRRITAYAALPTILWVIAGKRVLFLPVLFVPNSDFLSSRLLFLLFFLLISLGTFCLLAASAESH